MASRPEANGRGVQIGLNFSGLALLGPGGALQAAVTKAVKIGRRLGDGFADDIEAPDVLLFDSTDYPGGRAGGQLGSWGGSRRTGWLEGAGGWSNAWAEHQSPACTQPGTQGHVAPFCSPACRGACACCWVLVCRFSVPHLFTQLTCRPSSGGGGGRTLHAGAGG